MAFVRAGSSNTAERSGFDISIIRVGFAGPTASTGTKRETCLIQESTELVSPKHTTVKDVANSPQSRYTSIFDLKHIAMYELAGN